MFPFYYGIEYNQAEYMMRRWKDGGAARAVFLPMRDFMSKPSQFIRAITAARRGGADGACGFNFAVGDAGPEGRWQWKAVMLGAWANFPTPDLNALCLIEEPAELVEALAERELVVRVVSEAGDFDGYGHVEPFFDILPGARPASGPTEDGGLTIAVSNRASLEQNGSPVVVPASAWDTGKGIIQMRDTIVVHGRHVSGLPISSFLRLPRTGKSG